MLHSSSSSNTHTTHDKFQLTDEEAHKLEKAFKDPQFKSLFKEYLDDISSDQTRKEYESEITRWEAEHGNSITWIRPSPEFAIQLNSLGKFSYQNSKSAHLANELVNSNTVIINLASSLKIDLPSSTRTQKTDAQSGRVQYGMAWSLPHSLTPPRPLILELPTVPHGTTGYVFDIVYHPTVFLETSLINTLIETAIDSMEQKFGIMMDSADWLKLECKYYGTPVNTLIRNPTTSVPPKSDPDPFQTQCLPGPTPPSKLIQKPTTTILYRHITDMQDFTLSSPNSNPTPTRPNCLVVRTELPNVDSVDEVDADVHPMHLVISVPNKYHSMVEFTHMVDSDRAQAKWHADKRLLEIECPVIHGA